MAKNENQHKSSVHNFFWQRLTINIRTGWLHTVLKTSHVVNSWESPKQLKNESAGLHFTGGPWGPVDLNDLLQTTDKCQFLAKFLTKCLAVDEEKGLNQDSCKKNILYEHFVTLSLRLW